MKKIKNKLTETEEYLWHLISDNLTEIIKMSITQLSEYSNVSPATIVRTLKKKGFSGYTSYREKLRIEYSENYRTFRVLEEADKSIQNVIRKNEIELTNTLENLNYADIEDGIKLLQKSDRVYIFSRGMSELTARSLTTKLQLAGKYTESYSDPNIITELSKNIPLDAVVIFISLNGETSELVEASCILEEKNIPTIIFTANENSSLLPASTVSFVGYQSRDDFSSNYEVKSRLPLDIMTRIFADSYLVDTLKK